MSAFSVVNKEGKKSESIDLPDEIFGGRINTHVLHQAVLMYQASLRQGNASTKERAFVSGGGTKPYRQKGTGRARVGSNRSPLWIGGGTTFGPHPRDFSFSLPKKIKHAALRESLNSKYQEKDLHCVDDFKESLNKTKEFVKILKALGLEGKILVILDGSDDSVKRVSRNIANVQLMRSEDVTAYDILKNKKVLATRTSLQKLIDRAKK